MSPKPKFESEPSAEEQTPNRYEIRTGIELPALAEIDEVPESYFDRRHEVKDEPVQSDPPKYAPPMIPLSEVIANYEVKTPHNQPAMPKRTPLQHVNPQPTQLLSYGYHIAIGVIAGIAIAILLLIRINT